MTRMGISDARDHLSELVDRARYTEERVVLTKRGREVGAIISIDDLNLLEILEVQLDIKEARRVLAGSQGERISYVELRKKLAL